MDDVIAYYYSYVIPMHRAGQQDYKEIYDNGLVGTFVT